MKRIRLPPLCARSNGVFLVQLFAIAVIDLPCVIVLGTLPVHRSQPTPKKTKVLWGGLFLHPRSARACLRKTSSKSINSIPARALVISCGSVMMQQVDYRPSLRLTPSLQQQCFSMRVRETHRESMRQGNTCIMIVCSVRHPTDSLIRNV